MIYAEIKSGTKSVIKISKDVVNGNTFGQIRLWTEDKASGDLIPTKKGVAFTLDKTNDIVEALAKLQSDIEERKAEA